jgi:hypothetical protein
MTQKYDRFKDAPWFQEGVRPSVLVGGAGGIGSWLTVLLNRAGFETFVFDHDTLEGINMAGQLFMHKSIGQTKVDALATVVNEFCLDNIIGNFAKIDENTMTNEIAFSAFDNMKAREDMFTTWAMNFKGNPKAIFIDGRLTAEQLTIFCVKGDDEKAIEVYQKDHLFPDSDVPALPCTMAQTSHGAAMIAAHMTEFFTNWYAGVLERDTSRNVPFYWEYMIPIGFMHSEEAGDQKEAEKWADETIGEVKNDLPQFSTSEMLGLLDPNAPVPNEIVSSGFHGMLYTRQDGSQFLMRPDGTEEEWTNTVVPKEKKDEIGTNFEIPERDILGLGISSDRIEDLPSEDDQVLASNADIPGIGGTPFTIILGETEDTDLTPEEIKEIDDFLADRVKNKVEEVQNLVEEGINLMFPSIARPATPEEIAQFDQFLEDKGIPNPADPNHPSNSLNFEEDDHSEALPESPPTSNTSDSSSTNDLPF